MTSRWLLKRALKWSVEWGMTLSGAGVLYRGTRYFQKGLRILTYHHVGDRPRDSFTIGTAHFRAHMAYLADHHPVVGLTELVARLACGPPPEPGTVALTFDDGYADAVAAVCPTLQHYSLPATFFVVTGSLDGAKLPGGPFLTWRDVKQMVASGFAIGSHTVNHPSLGTLDERGIEHELAESRSRISDETGVPPAGLSYPYGTVRDFSSTVAAVAENVGYLYAVTAVHGLNHDGRNRFFLRRTTLTAGDNLRTFRMILNGCLDPWYFVDTWGFVWQRTHPSFGPPMNS
jgi:peptidoglycan/xylan/chitin deacetylase (PgdA/CDA1 family)